MITRESRFRSLPCKRFRTLLTLFSKFFSPLPRGTCSLSVSHLYLALGVIYLPVDLGLQSQTTRLEENATTGAA